MRAHRRQCGNLCVQLWKDQRGAVVSAEYVFLASVVALALVLAVVAIHSILGRKVLEQTQGLGDPEIVVSPADDRAPGEQPIRTGIEFQGGPVPSGQVPEERPLRTGADLPP